MSTATNTDRWGCSVTGSEAEAALIDRVSDDYVTMAPAIDRHFEALASGGPLARAVLAQLLTQAHRPSLSQRAVELTEEATTEMGPLTDRERAQVEAAWSWCRGDIEGAIAAFARALAAEPTDALALRARYLLLFSIGEVAEMLASVERARAAWPEDLARASYLDGMEGFAVEELGRDYRRAEELGRRGVDRDPSDLWAIHAVSHVLEMEARREEGASWLDGRDEMLEAAGGFRGHLWWHQALQLLALGEIDAVLDLYDRRVYPGASEEGLDLSNAISLLARIEATGGDVGDRWAALAGPAAVRLGQHSHPFNDTHFALALARAGQREAARAHVASMARWAERGDHAATVLATVGLATAEAMVAYGEGDWSTAVATMGPVRSEIWRLGGSEAQRRLYSTVYDRATAQRTTAP